MEPRGAAVSQERDAFRISAAGTAAAAISWTLAVDMPAAEATGTLVVALD